MKRDPLLAEFYQQEAKDVEIPILEKNKNMTVAGKLAKDPSTAALVQLAQRIHENWLAEDNSPRNNSVRRQRKRSNALKARLHDRRAITA